MYGKWTDTEVKYIFSIVSHFHWFVKTHQRTTKLVHYKLDMFSDKAPRKAWKNDNQEVEPGGTAQLVEQSTSDLKFKGLNPAPASCVNLAQLLC